MNKNSQTLKPQNPRNQNPSSSSSWTFTIRTLISQKNPKSAIETYIQNRKKGTFFIISAIPLILKACASLSLPTFGKSLHSEVLKSGVQSDVTVCTSLITMYGKSREIDSARKVFDEMPVRNVVAWNAMIGMYTRNGFMGFACSLFGCMDVEKSSVSWNEMVDGYAKNGDMSMARRVFDSVPDRLRNVVTWTCLVDGYVSNGDMEGGLEMFGKMGKRNFYVWSVIIRGYFKKGEFVKAREVFDGMGERNLVNWNTLISGYAQNGMFVEALDCFVRMQDEGFEPDGVTFASALSACAQSGMLDFGKRIHEMIVRKRIELNEFVQNGLVDMYSKCGDLENARLIFDGMSVRNSATSWNSLITGFAIHGQCREAVDLFSRMEKSSVKPDNVSFLSVLSACAHGGFVEEGLEVFSKMEKYRLKASVKHYGCLVDLLGRAGKLKEAFNLVKGMPMAPNDTVLGALLGACRIHSDTIMTDNVLRFVNAVSSCHEDAHCVLLSNIYAASERWEMAEGMRVVFSGKGSEKTPGCSAVML